MPTGYTHVVEVNSGRTIYIAGQVALDRSGNVVGKGDFAAQTNQVFENLKLALAGVGASFDNVVKINTYVTDMSQIQTLRDIRSRYYSKNAPASTLVQVGKLAREELMIEIEAIAVVPE
jgi:reactive intermediate/imine deaminase